MRSSHVGGGELLAERAGNGLDRRNLFKHGLIWGTVAAATGAPGSALAAAGRTEGRLSRRQRRRAIALDVACLGHTLRLAPAPVGDPVETALGSGLLYGTSFLVEGNIYPAGTIEGEQGFDPDSAPASGHWLCRGWVMGRSDREEPGVLTTQEYLLERISEEDPYPADQLTSSGIEPGPVGASVPRTLLGGTGSFAGRGGEVIQRVTGTNRTTLPDGSPAPNFHFRFRLSR